MKGTNLLARSNTDDALSIKKSSDTAFVIHDLSRGGAGVSRQEDGRIVFIPFTAPGDVVRARIIEQKKSYAQAELLEVIRPAPERRTPPCPVFGRCGGCQWQHLPYDLQWKTKVQGVRHALSRVQVALSGELEELPAERVWEYRNRVQLRGFKHELGFFAAGSHDRVAVDRCAIARPEINAAWERIRGEGMRLDRPYKVEVEVLPGGELLESWNASHGAHGFRQVHDEQNEKLKAWVARSVTPGGALLDLFGGAGNLSLGLAGAMKRIDCVDTGAPRQSTEARGGLHYGFHQAPVARWIVKKASARPRSAFDSAILDPPREGLGSDIGAIAGALEELGVRELIAVGCDVDAWARDISRFVVRGWRLERAAVLDLFPQTPHVESLALLRR
jgi:23S rRNA (uracil1939-C5)-methyltransferase